MKQYDCIIIGGGHAGIEAALACARMGRTTLMVTMSLENIGRMSCNPAIGGVGKGQLVKEIDALGGLMGLAADQTAIQFRQLNASKGQAVRSSRCQSDKRQYQLYVQQQIRRQQNLDLLQGRVARLIVRHHRITGIQMEQGDSIACQAVVVATGTFLDGRIHIGSRITPAGRMGESNVTLLTENLRDLGFEITFFKTGTPPRLDGKTIDFSCLDPQHSDAEPKLFSFRSQRVVRQEDLRPCYITHTNARTHAIIRQNMHLSPMYSGQIQATGVRYCPSIEDKLKKFADRDQHQIFLEPQGLDTDSYYPNGISTGLPADVQEQFVRTIKGLERVTILRPGYSIEHGVISPLALTASLEAKHVEGLFFAGQINRTTGYEEAAAQGLMAGINAALKVAGQSPFVLGRHEAYIGVLIDDLITKGTEEPYRMFTSRVEYRLLIREDNADQRLSHYARDLGLLSEATYRRIEQKYARIEREIARLRSTRLTPTDDLNQALRKKGTTPLRQHTLLSDLLKRPQIDYAFLRPFSPYPLLEDPVLVEQVQYAIKYEGFIAQQKKDVEKFQYIEHIRIPDDINYDEIQGLSIEVRQKLRQMAPSNLGQANRISGVTPSAISVLMIYLRGRKKTI